MKRIITTATLTLLLAAAHPPVAEGGPAGSALDAGCLEDGGLKHFDVAVAGSMTLWQVRNNCSESVWVNVCVKSGTDIAPKSLCRNIKDGSLYLSSTKLLPGQGTSLLDLSVSGRVSKGRIFACFNTAIPHKKGDGFTCGNGKKSNSDGDLWSPDGAKTTTTDSNLWKLPIDKQSAKTDDLWTAPKNKQTANADERWQSDTTKLRDDLAEWKRKEKARKAEEKRNREEAERIARANAEAARIALAKIEKERKRAEEEARRRRDDKVLGWMNLVVSGLTQYANVKSGNFPGGSNYSGSANTAGLSAGCLAAQKRAERRLRELANKSDQGNICSAYRDTLEHGRALESVIPACSGDWSAAEIQAQRDLAQRYIVPGEQGVRQVCVGG